MILIEVLMDVPMEVHVLMDVGRGRGLLPPLILRIILT